MTHPSPEAHRAHRRSRVDTKYENGHAPKSAISGADREGKLASRDMLESGGASKFRKKPGRLKNDTRASGGRTGTAPGVHSK